MNCLEKINDYTYVIEDKIKSILHMIWDELMSLVFDSILGFMFVLRLIIVCTFSIFAVVSIFSVIRFIFTIH